jgi:glycosyltransferase involved in cell wall biosynthesis
MLNVNGRFMTRRATGVDRFAVELLRAWTQPGSGARHVRAFTPTKAALVVRDLPVDVVAAGRLGGHSWEQFELPNLCGGGCLVSLCGTGPAIYKRQLAVLHDANVMANPWVFSFAFRNWYRMLFKSLMRRAAVVATVSRFSASELTKYFGVRAAGLEVIYESGEHVLRTPASPGIIGRLGLTNCRFVLAVGSRSPNKNFAGVVQAAAKLADLGIKVVFAGGSNSRVFAGNELTGENLVLAGYVSDEELRALYERADCFLYPSFYEGFGLPPLEAMHCGCPVIVSNGSSLPEICGEAAVYCEPGDPADIAKQVRRVLTSESLRRELKEAGLARAATFTWQRSADTFQEILERYRLCE